MRQSQPRADEARVHLASQEVGMLQATRQEARIGPDRPDFDLAAGVNPQTIAIRFDGAEKLSVNAAGELVIQLDGGQIIQQAPLAYQTVDGLRQTVKADREARPSPPGAGASWKWAIVAGPLRPL